MTPSSSEAAKPSSSSSSSEGPLPATDMIYYTYEGNFQLECDAKVLTCQFIKSKNETNDQQEQMVELCLDKTVLHAQGGGQPTDLGSIVLKDGDDENGTEKNVSVNVTKVLMDRTTGVATHTGVLVSKSDDNSNNNGGGGGHNSLQPGDMVHVSVDAANREILSECHTAGHVVDMSMARCGATLPPLKGYHFLDGPYVEYKGKIPENERQILLEKLQAAFQELVEEDIDTQIAVLPKAEAEEVCNRVAENYFNMSDFGDETIRIVTVAGWPCPCGGTHVKSTGKLKARNWGITGFRCKKGVVRVRYGQNWNE